MILSATVSANNLPDFDFPTFLPDVGPAAAAVVPLIPGDMDGHCCQSRAVQRSLRDHWSSSERSLEGDSPLHRPLPADHPHQSMNILHVKACVKVSFFLVIHIQTPLMWLSWIIWFCVSSYSTFVALWSRCSQTALSPLYTLLYGIEPVNLFQPAFHMLPLTWRCDDAPVQLVVGGEPLTPAANQTACRLKGVEGGAQLGGDGDGASRGQ